MKYVNTQVGFREVPNQISLLINISNCQCKCPGCHSKYLWEDIGTELTTTELFRLIDNNNGVNCICFMGGHDYKQLNQLALDVRLRSDYPYKVCWYTGEKEIPEEINLYYFDYIKVGPYIDEKGPLDSKTTNQRMYLVTKKGFNKPELSDITYLFWSSEVLTTPLDSAEEHQEKPGHRSGQAVGHLSGSAED